MDPAYFLRHGAVSLVCRLALGEMFPANCWRCELCCKGMSWIPTECTVLYATVGGIFFSSSSWREKHNTRHLSFGTGRQEAVMRCDITKVRVHSLCGKSKKGSSSFCQRH